MLRSKSRSGSFRFGKKDNNSVLSRTLSASKICRGDALISQIDTTAVVSLDRNPSKAAAVSSENRMHRGSKMQQQMNEIEEELKNTKVQLGAAKEERDRAFDELREMKLVAQQANLKLSESLSNTKQELKVNEKTIESLKLELEKAKKLVLKLNEELSNVKESEALAMGSLSEIKKRVHELEAESERGKLSESKMFQTVVSQTQQLEETNIELEESKLEIASLSKKLESSRDLNGSRNDENVRSMNEAFENLKSELKLAKENLGRAEEGGKKVFSSKTKSLLEEMELLKNELKMAIEAEETSKKAMDDLAMALKEVATEANQAKEKLGFTQVELEHVKEEAEKLKGMVRNTEDKYKKLLDESKKETELYKNTSERLRFEAEESLLAWNGKEMGFVGCIKRAEDERNFAQKENIRLIESFKSVENMTRVSRDENLKLRDILKQALNEASVAKEAAGIAREENSQLKDCLSEKDEALDFLTRENERLRINEAAANESIKELKRLLSAASKLELKNSNPISNQHEEGENLKNSFSFNLREIKFLHEPVDIDDETPNEDPEKAEALKGSIFDTTVSPKSEPHTPKSASHRQSGSSFTDDGETINSEDYYHLDGKHLDDAENDRNSQSKRRALLRRFGDLLMRRRSFQKKEITIE